MRPRVAVCRGVVPTLTLTLIGMLLWEAQDAVGQGRRLEPETYHWVLPAQYDGVDVVELHPGDCYVIQRADGVVYFGDPLPDVAEIQPLLGAPVAHVVEDDGEQPVCRLGTCVALARLTEVITAQLIESGDPRSQRSANHRPSPLDGMRGGAYSDVGSPHRTRYRRAAEQRMAYLHRRTARRDNCYEAQVPRMLTIHIRDRNESTARTGVYSGYLYLEHHHDPPRGRVAALAGVRP